MSNVSAHVLLRGKGSMQLASSCFGHSRGLPASARQVVLSSSGTYGSVPVSAKPLAPPLLEGSGFAPAPEASRPSVGRQSVERPEEHGSRLLVPQARAMHSVVLRSATLASSGVQGHTEQLYGERANPSIKRTVKGLRPSPAAYVKR